MAEKAIGVSINKKREKPRPEVDLVTPHGAQITVSQQRAETLLERPGVRLGDGGLRKYVEAGEDPLVEELGSGARAPRAGSRDNTGAE